MVLLASRAMRQGGVREALPLRNGGGGWLGLVGERKLESRLTSGCYELNDWSRVGMECGSRARIGSMGNKRVSLLDVDLLCPPCNAGIPNSSL